MGYSLLHVIHLLSSIFFVGALFVDVLVLDRVRQQSESPAMQPIDKAIAARMRVVLHWVVMVVYGAGIGLGWYHREALKAPLSGSFSALLTIKILLAVGVFMTYGRVALLLRSGRLTPARYRRIRWVIFTQMIGIVLLAKGMFYAHW